MSLPADAQDRLRYLVVRVAGRLCALPLEPILEVLRTPPLERAQESIAGLLGFATLRGEPCAVFSLALLLGLAADPEARAAGQRTVRVRLGQGVAALTVDEVMGLQQIQRGALTRIDLPGGRERRLGRFETDFARLIDPGGLLPENLPVLSAAAAGGGVKREPA